MSKIRVALSEGWLAFVVLMALVMAKMGARHDPLDGRILVWRGLAGMALGICIVYVIINLAECREARTRAALRAVIAGLLGTSLILGGMMRAGWVAW